VEFDVTWKHALAKGSNDSPEIIASRFAKTNGSSVIHILECSIIVTRLADDSAQIELEEHVNAFASGSDKVVQYLKDFHANIVAYVHNQPLPKYH